MIYKITNSLFLFTSVIVDQTPEMRALTERVIHRLDSAYKPKTWSAYKAICFVCFCRSVFL